MNRCANCSKPVQNPGDYLCTACVTTLLHRLEREDASADLEFELMETRPS